MNLNNGEILLDNQVEGKIKQIMNDESVSYDEAMRIFINQHTMFKPSDATPLQLGNKQVSKHDSKSKLGKIFTAARKKSKVKGRPKNFKW